MLIVYSWKSNTRTRSICQYLVNTNTRPYVKAKRPEIQPLSDSAKLVIIFFSFKQSRFYNIINLYILNNNICKTWTWIILRIIHDCDSNWLSLILQYNKFTSLWGLFKEEHGRLVSKSFYALCHCLFEKIIPIIQWRIITFDCKTSWENVITKMFWNIWMVNWFN